MTAAAQLFQRNAGRVLASAGEVGSPCISVCRMGADGLCEGCWRNLDEIAEWSDFDDAERRAVWRRLVQRAQAAVT
jgi:predicted Fe-S protein YdhL (DUF1289 family)